MRLPVLTLAVSAVLACAGPALAQQPPMPNPAEIKKLLDNGVQTLLVPYVQNAEEARYTAAAVAYPPEGFRGMAGLTRATGFGTIPDYAHKARAEICLIVQIETLSAVEELDEICAVPGVDAVFVGPADLAGFHGTNERLSVENMGHLSRSYAQIVMALDTPEDGE